MFAIPLATVSRSVAASSSAAWLSASLLVCDFAEPERLVAERLDLRRRLTLDGGRLPAELAEPDADAAEACPANLLHTSMLDVRRFAA